MEQDKKGQNENEKNDAAGENKETGANIDKSDNIKPAADMSGDKPLSDKPAEENHPAAEKEPVEENTEKKPETDAADDVLQRGAQPESESDRLQRSENKSNADNDGNDENMQKNGDAEDAKENGRRGIKIKAIIYPICIVIVSIILAVSLLLSVTDYLGMFRVDKTAKVKIPANASTQQIASILKNEGIIRSPFVFKMYVSFSKNHNIRSGVYTLNSQMSYSDILHELRSRATVKVTIPEGFTLQRIGELLQKKKVCSQKAFLAAVQKTNVDFKFSSQIPNNKYRFYRLEGYLFPDTYDFFRDQSADEVVTKMLDDFDSRFDATLQKEADSSGMTVDQVVTLASIIQAEASKTSEMNKVSSVFRNRLEKGIAGKKFLQSDATIFYAIRDIEPVDSRKAEASAYNTYKHEGLTPGPICNPGLAAIKAALSPADTPYFYFVTDKSGNYYYAKTYKQHVINVNAATKTGKSGGTNTAK